MARLNSKGEIVMASNNQEVYEAKLTDVVGIPRGRVPMGIVRHLNGRVGDYMIFRVSKSGVVTVTLRPQTGSKKKASVKKKK